MVTGKGPTHAARRCRDAGRASPRKYENDDAHGHSPSYIVDTIVEDLDKRETSVGAQHGSDVAEAEQHGQHHCEADEAVGNHARADGARDVQRWVIHLLGHVHRGVSTDKGRDVAQKADAVGKSLGGPAAVVEGSLEDGRGAANGGGRQQRGHDGDEAADVQDHDEQLEARQQAGDDDVDEDIDEEDGPG